MYVEPTVADDSKMKDSAVDADTLKDPSDLTGTYTECTSGLYKMLQVTSTMSLYYYCVYFKLLAVIIIAVKGHNADTLWYEIYIIVMSVFRRRFRN